MNATFPRAGRWVVLLVLLVPGLAAAEAASSRIVGAANAFLATLDAQKKETVLFAFDDAKQRVRWSNFPTGVVQRGGLSLKEMTAAQRSAAMALMAAALSQKGLAKVQAIMEGDEVLLREEASHPNRPRGGGGPPPGGGNGPPPGFRPGGPPSGGLLFGKDLYFISFLGKPSTSQPWMLQFGGHHLALNITYAGAGGILTPTLTGAQPALYTVDGKTVRPLADESDKALALLASLDEGQRKQAVLGYRVSDLVTGPGQDGKTIVPEGLKASLLSEPQRALLLEIVASWAGIVEDDAAAARMAQLRAELADTWFAWSGPATASPGKNITAYYRIQGPHLIIEYAPQGLGGDSSLHVHTMYRDPTNDYGRAAVGK